MLSFIEEIPWLAVVLEQERNGCTLAQALIAIPHTVEHRRLLARLVARSRIIRHDPEGLDLWWTPLGEYWVPMNEGPPFLFVLAEIENDTYESELVGVKPGDVVLDCGAHVGTFSRRALAARAGLVVAIEPGRKQLECLRRNLAAEIGAGRVRIIGEGVWDKQDQLDLHSNSDSATASLVFCGTSSSSERVPVTTIDEIVSRLNLDKVDFLKMDIEGAEQKALSGAAATLARFMPRLAIAAYHVSDDAIRIPAVVRGANGRYAMESVGCRLDLVQTRPLTLIFR